MKSLLLPVVLFALLGTAKAFPPAPYYTLHGIVRDQVGQTITAEGAEVVLLRGTKDVGRTPITRAGLERNYLLNFRMDQNRSGTITYDERAINTESAYSLAVDIGGVRYYPIEVSGNLTAGKGGERVRLDLNLGEDSDKDGLPDVWEQWQLYQAGYILDGNGKWPINLLDRNGDFDKDGLSNWQEYVAGTFAGDATEKFDLTIKEETAAYVRFEFYGIIGKTYTIEKTTDFQNWTRIPISVGANGIGQASWTSDGIGIFKAYTPPENAAKCFYRLNVR